MKDIKAIGLAVQPDDGPCTKWTGMARPVAWPGGLRC